MYLDSQKVVADFREGQLIGYPGKGEETHGPITLCWGRVGSSPYEYSLLVQDLERLPEKILLRYHPLNDHTEARRTLTGGIRIRRIQKPPWIVDSKTATFTSEEYKEIQNYI